ncbi:type II toxin-antitoxin system RelE/ParE family toxin [Candidatus Sumerlaeota bacterium]|nr:type II toxin-antitoxin system RelE/ParE family toxin [Candidatus Sumerlaeota bacterium]
MPKRAVDDSSKFRIFETDEFQKRLVKLPARDARFIQRKLAEYVYPQLRADPFLGPNIKKLRGYQPDTWRYRVGRFRIFYIVDQEELIVSMLTVDDRKDAYR